MVLFLWLVAVPGPEKGAVLPMEWQELAGRLEILCSLVGGRSDGFVFAEDPLPAQLAALPHCSGNTADSPADRLRFALEDACEESLEALRQFRSGRIGSADVIATIRVATQIIQDLAPLIAWGDEWLWEQYHTLVTYLGLVPATIDRSAGPRRDFYVYAHCDATGTPFYIGAGRDKAAWWRDRRSWIWHEHVSNRLHGVFEVAILKSGMTADEAATYKQKLLQQHGEHLVNHTDNPHVGDDIAIARRTSLRDATHQFVADTKVFERSDPELAISRYREAIAAVRQYEDIRTERGLVGEIIRRKFPPAGDLAILDRLTLCLFRQGRFTEVVDAVAEYERLFPGARARIPEGVRKRAARAVLAADQRHAAS
jgi:hypothetical protein